MALLAQLVILIFLLLFIVVIFFILVNLVFVVTGGKLIQLLISVGTLSSTEV